MKPNFLFDVNETKQIKSSSYDNKQIQIPKTKSEEEISADIRQRILEKVKQIKASQGQQES